MRRLGRLRDLDWSTLIWPGLVWPALALLATLTLYLVGGFQGFDRQIADLRFRLLERPAPQALVVVAIDASSLAELEVWPWPRRFYAQAIDRLLAAGARDIAFDIDFSSRSTPEEDGLLAAALARAGPRVVLPTFRQWQDSGSGEGQWAVNLPLPRFMAGKRLASVNVWQESDGLVRRAAVVDRGPNSSLPSMAALLAGAGDLPYDSFFVDFALDPRSLPRISFADLLRGDFDPALVRGKKVLIGATAAELRDDIPVPVRASLSGALFHALAYHSLAEGRALQRPGILPLGLLGLVLALGLAGAFRRWSWRLGFLVVALGSLVLFLVSLQLQASLPLLPEVAPLIFLLLLLFAGGVVQRVDLQTLELFLQGLRLRQLDQTMRKVVESSFDGIVTADPDGRILTANRAAQRIFGFGSEPMVGHWLGEFLPDFDGGVREGNKPGGSELLNDRSLGERETSGRRGDGGSVPLEIAVSDLWLQERRQFVLVLRDATERKRQLRQLEHQALHDALTGLPNRSLLLDRLGQAIELSRRRGDCSALLIMDLDRFKMVNDTLGHQMGDRLLRAVAGRLSGPLRKMDTLARLGGDEFAIVLPGLTDPDKAEEIAGRLREALDKPFEIAGLSLDIGGSVGIALFPTQAEDPEKLMQCADVAMYQAKQSGGRVSLYDPEQDQNSVRYLTLNGELRQAIEQEQLYFNYQPKLDLASGRVVAAEALIRWKHESLGFVPPDEFILQAEQSGLIDGLTQLAFRLVLNQIAAWRREGLNLNVAINLSAHNLQDEDLPEQVQGHLEQSGVPPECLTLEITETAIMVDPERAAEVVRRLHALGACISVDDFGTGHSSLAYLKRLPLHELKIDRSFVMQMTEDDDDAIIVRSTVDLAHNLGLKVVAEGVETESHLQILRGLGCDKAQGYLISRPLDAEAFSAWCKQHNGLVSGEAGAQAGATEKSAILKALA